MLRYDAMIFAMILLLGFLSSGARSATVSQHNEQHAAEQAALDRLYDAGCQRTLTTRSGRFGLHDSVSGEYTISGVTLTVRCTQWPAPPGETEPVFIVHDITWQRPTTRTDGSTLPADQISGYMLEIDGAMTFIGNVLRYEATYSVAMIHTYRIATVDIFGQQGPWANEVRL